MARNLSMRPSRVLAKMRDGGVATCVKVNTGDPRVVDMIGRFDFDCAWVCMEHVPGSIDVVERQIAAASANDMDIIVRVRRGGYSDLVGPLEANATGIMVPHVMNAEEATRIVYYTKFHPVGRRPWDGGNADGAFGMMDSLQYIRQANAERFTILQIEDPEAVEVLDDIAAVAGYDMLFYGPSDYAQGIGAPGEFDDPRVVAAYKLVADAARAHGKFAGTLGSPAKLADLVDMGYQFINVGYDVIGLGNYLSRLADDVANARGRRA